MTALLVLQCFTYIALGAMFYAHGNWKLGTAQLLLAVVQGLIFS